MDKVLLKVNISVSRPGAASRPSDQPAPPRPTSNGLPVAVAHQPVKQPVQMAPQVPLNFRASRYSSHGKHSFICRLLLLLHKLSSLHGPPLRQCPSNLHQCPKHRKALATLLILIALPLTACPQVIASSFLL